MVLFIYISLAISEDCQNLLGYLFLGGKEVGFQSYAINSPFSLMPWQRNFAEIAGLEAISGGLVRFNILNPPKRVGNRSVFGLWNLLEAS